MTPLDCDSKLPLGQFTHDALRLEVAPVELYLPAAQFVKVAIDVAAVVVLYVCC